MNGLHAVLVTPFDQHGNVDNEGLDRLVEFYLANKVSGIVTLSVMGESSLLNDTERFRVAQRVISSVNGRVPVVVGINRDEESIVPKFVRQVVEIGASSLLISPRFLTTPTQEAELDYFDNIASATNASIIVLDYPPASGTVSVQFLKDLAARVESVVAIKLEELPTALKITRLKSEIGNRLNILCASGSVYCLQELERGCDGFITGYAFPEHLVNILESFRAGDTAGAAAIYGRWLPLFVYCNQAGIEVAIRKEILKYRGVIKCAAVRRPTRTLDDITRDELHRLLRTMDL